MTASYSQSNHYSVVDKRFTLILPVQVDTIFLVYVLAFLTGIFVQDYGFKRLLQRYSIPVVSLGLTATP
jgi:hypothetical protein